MKLDPLEKRLSQPCMVVNLSSKVSSHGQLGHGVDSEWHMACRSVSLFAWDVTEISLSIMIHYIPSKESHQNNDEGSIDVTSAELL